MKTGLLGEQTTMKNNIRVNLQFTMKDINRREELFDLIEYIMSTFAIHEDVVKLSKDEREITNLQNKP